MRAKLLYPFVFAVPTAILMVLLFRPPLIYHLNFTFIIPTMVIINSLAIFFTNLCISFPKEAMPMTYWNYVLYGWTSSVTAFALLFFYLCFEFEFPRYGVWLAVGGAALITMAGVLIIALLLALVPPKDRYGTQSTRNDIIDDLHL